MQIHSSAIVHPHAELADDVTIGPFCVIDAHVRIESGCRLDHGVYLTGWTEIAEHCRLHPGAIVGHEPQDARYRGERSFCRIGRGCTLRENVTVHRGTDPDSETVVGDECFLLGGSHVAHNCTLGKRVTLINNVLLGGHASIGDGATFGGGAVVHQFVRVGELAMIPGNGRVIQDVCPFALLDVDGRVAGLNRVGLRRAGFSRDEINAVRDAYRVLFSDAGSLRNAARTLAETTTSRAVRQLAEFVLAESRRGLAGRARRARRADPHEHPDAL